MVAEKNEHRRFTDGGKRAVWQASYQQSTTGLVEPVILGDTMLM
jgi:hypothetical protein